MGSLIDKAFDTLKEKEREAELKELAKQKKLIIKNINDRLKEMNYEDIVYLRKMMANMNNVKDFFTTMHHLSRNLG